MQTDNSEFGKVVKLARLKKSKEGQNNKDTKEEVSFTFNEIIKRNAENRARVEQERKKSNKGVIRSYRLKH